MSGSSDLVVFDDPPKLRQVGMPTTSRLLGYSAAVQTAGACWIPPEV